MLKRLLPRGACVAAAMHAFAEQAPAQSMPESAARAADRRSAYEIAYRECPVDSLRALVGEGSIASDVVREYVAAALVRADDAVMAPGEPRRFWEQVHSGCSDALAERPSRYDPAARAALARAAESRRLSQERGSTLGSYAWVFYLDVVLGVLLLAAGAAFRHRDDDKTLRRWWVVAAALMGAFFGAAVFVAIGIMATLTMMMSQPSEVMLAAMTTIAIAFGGLGMALSPRGRGRWRTR